MRSTVFAVIIFLCSLGLLGQEYRSTTTVTSANQPVTVDLTNVSDVRGASISIHNSSSNAVLLPQISLPNNLMPVSGAAILTQLNSLPPVTTDQDRVIQTWQYVLDHTHHFCYAGNKNSVIYDPISVLDGFGFGCCEQLSYVLAWIWQQEGYQTRLAALPGFHTVPEVYYTAAWHMLDPDHRVIYLKDDGSIASTEEIIADSNLVARVADTGGKDPTGFVADEMAASYALYGRNLQYALPVNPRPLSTIVLRPLESLVLHPENLQDTVGFYSSGTYLAPSSANSAEFVWDLSFGNSYALRYAYAGSGIQVVADSLGSKVLVNTSSSPGYIVYQEYSLFPVLGASVDAQFGADNQGSLKAYVSLDGVHWPSALPFQSALGQSSFDQTSDLTTAASGTYSYFVKIELGSGAQLHRLRITSRVQTAKFFFPNLNAGSINQLWYEDSSPLPQARSLSVTTAIRSGAHRIRGVRARSLVPESPPYSISRDNGAANLVDQDQDSLAYPGSTHVDYLVQLNGTYRVSGVSIDWKYFGTDARYVKSWQVLATNGGQTWQAVAGGGFPGNPTTDVNLDVTATALRLVADGSNWIGIYEVRIFGNTTGPSFRVNPLIATSNIPESPTYSLAQNYGASSLVDGNPKTLAYPGSTKVDYSISLPNSLHLTSALITWGYYGSTPGYIDSWNLLTRNGTDQPWTTVAHGSFPGSNSSTINLDVTANEMRIVASSLQNWIGIYELAFYSPVPGPVTALSARSNVTEIGGSPSSNLVDDDDSSVAAPGNASLDYTIDSGQTTFVDSVRLVWGSFGTDLKGIDSWRLLGLPSNSRTWEVIARGGPPNAPDTSVQIGDKYRQLRVATVNATLSGMNEVHVFGARMAANNMSVKSNVLESASSLANHQNALSLIDGDTTTLAYPGGPHLDYQVSLGAPTQLSQAVIDWGVFGIKSIYVNSWSLLGRTSPGEAWVTLAQGGFPNSGVTTVALNASVTDVRIVADGSSWIGVYELQLK